MFKAANVFMFILVTCFPSFAGQAICNKISNQVWEEAIMIFPVSAYKVVGEERLYFHTAPNENCRSKDVFVIPDDQLIAYTEYKEWFRVYYKNPKTLKSYYGWVQSKRLKFTSKQLFKYEPEVVVIVGRLSTRKFEHPNGEWYPLYIIQLPQPATIEADPIEEVNIAESNVKEIQLWSSSEKIVEKIKINDGKHVLVIGTLFHELTAWHRRPLVMDVLSIQLNGESGKKNKRE